MKRVLVALLVLVWAPSLGFAQQTHNTVPSATSTFITDLQTFLKNEDPNRIADFVGSFVVSGGIHGTAAGLTATPTALLAYPSGYYATETGSITYPNNATCWVVATYTTTSTLSGSFSRVAGTKYATDCVSASKPTAPANSVFLMKVVTAAGSITTVTDLRPALGLTASLRGWTDFQSFGAKGDGTTDDTVAIQAALDNLSSGGVAWCPPPPVAYKITGTLTFNFSNIWVLGPANKSCQLKITSRLDVTSFFTASGKSGIRVENIYVLGAGGPISTTHDFGVNFTNCSDCKVINNIFDSLAGSAIVVSGSAIGSKAANVSIVGNKITGGFGDGIASTYGQLFRIYDNYITGTPSASTTNWAVNLKAHYNTYVAGNVVNGGTNGIELINTPNVTGATLPSQSTISLNNVTGTTSGASYYLEAYNVSVFGNISDTSATHGIYIGDADYSTCTNRTSHISVLGNLVRNSTNAGILIDTDGNNIVGNTIINSNTSNGATYLSGIELQASECFALHYPTSNVINANSIENVINTEAGETNGLTKYGVTLCAGCATNIVIANRTIGLTAGGLEVHDLGSTNTVVYSTQGQFVALTYPGAGGTVTPDCSLGTYQKVVVTDNGAWTMAAPINCGKGQQFFIWIFNSSGTTLGTITWNVAYKMSTWSNPKNTFNRSILFVWDGTKAYELSTPAPVADIPN